MAEDDGARDGAQTRGDARLGQEFAGETFHPKSGSCSWSGFAEALVELGDERICRDPRGSPCG